MEPILNVQNISKKYRIGASKSRYLSMREELSQFWKKKNRKEDFWALTDVSFQVNNGDSIGIIGRNGAGKSTLLKVLSRITPPTKGSITVNGRVASLLEVGTGFHFELTGRENIYLNGSILGLTRKEIDKKYDEIVAFSGVEKFLETPLKHYSSGMQLRLAFSVAAHLEPEILIVDEVLAVGDTEFQQKCLGKMGEVIEGGRTILFVSHDLTAVSNLCKTGLILNEGKIINNGPINEMVAFYSNNLASDLKESVLQLQGMKILDDVVIQKITFELSDNQLHVWLNLEGDVSRISSVILNVFAQSGERIALIDYRSSIFNSEVQLNKSLHIESKIDLTPLVEGIYFFTLGIESNKTNWFETDRFSIEIVESASSLNKYAAKYRGYFELESTTEVNIT